MAVDDTVFDALARHDVAICGGGPVGLALAAMLVRQGMAPARVALLDGRELDVATRDPRSIAVSHGSRQLLEQIGAWPWQDTRAEQHGHGCRMADSGARQSGQGSQGGATPIREIHVSRRGSLGRTLITAQDFGVPALGYVIRYGDLVAALAQAVENAGVSPLRPAMMLGSEEHADGVRLQLAHRPAIQANLMVVAEGGMFAGAGAGADAVAPSPSRAVSRPGAAPALLAPAAPGSGSYDQTAVIAFVKVSTAPAARAFERFTEEGPLALLPQDDGYALVWCVRPRRAEALMRLPDGAFLAQLQEAFGQRLGRFVSTGARSTYALGLKFGGAQTPRSVSIGNAAQTLHPVAGQGLNLGLRDAAVLAGMLARSATPQTLARFASARRNDRGTMVRLTDTMARIFASSADGSLRQSLLGLSLGLVDGCAPLKQLLGESMMFGRRP
ncbi:MAG: FAD-dependent monooxygenase [Janthinobacterium lividum]